MRKYKIEMSFEVHPYAITELAGKKTPLSDLCKGW